MTLRLAQFCYPPNNWVIQAGNVTSWHDRTFFMFKHLKSKLPELDMVYQHPQPRMPDTNFRAIKEGLTDVDPGLFGISWNRYQVADFSVPLGYSEINIISKKVIKRSVFEGIFDDWSLILMLVTLMSLWLLLKILVKRSLANELGWFNCFLLALGCMLKEPLSLQHVIIRAKQLRKVVILINVFGLFITMMYQAIIISVLAAGKTTKQISSLEDIVKRPDIRIVAFQSHIPHILIQRSVFYPELEARIDLKARRNWETEMQAYQMVRDGTHVFVEYKGLFQHFWRSMPEEVLCTLSPEDFLVSRPLTSVAISMLYRKGLPYAPTIDMAVLWLRAFGLRLDVTHSLLDWTQDQDGIMTAKTNATCTKMVKVFRVTDTGCRQPKSKLFALSHEYLESLWIATGVALTISLVVFGSEIVVETKKRKQRKKQPSY